MTIIGVLGLGSIGRRHATNANAEGASVFGFDPDRAQRERARETGIETAETRDALFERCDAIVIASPSDRHLADLTETVERGRHAFVEKPMAHTTAGLKALLGAAGHAGLTVFVGHNLRFNPAAIKARDLIAQAALGTVLWADVRFSSYLPDWRPAVDHRTGYAANPRTGGVIFDLTHEFDLAWFLLGRYESVTAYAWNSGTLGIESEDCAEIVLRHANDAVSRLHLDFATPRRHRSVTIAGTDLELTLSVDDRTVELVDRTGALVEQHRFDGAYDDDYRDEMRAFLSCIDGAPPACPPTEALDVLEQVVAARQLCGLPQ